MLTERQRRYLETGRVARLATADSRGRPHVVPVCYALVGDSIYITIDEKPKRTQRPLKRMRNISQNPSVALVADTWDEDWSRLGYVMVRGRAEILPSGHEHDEAQASLRRRYPQLRGMRIESLPVIAIRIEAASAWGRLEDPPPDRS